MELYNPFEDVSKAATVPPQHATVLRVLVPTGNNVGHGLDLKRVTAKTKGPRRPALEVYGRKKVSKGSVKQGLDMISSMPKTTSVPRPPRKPGRVRIAEGRAALARNNGTPTGSTTGRRFT